MAKKSKAQQKSPRRQARQRQAAQHQPWWRQKMLLGGVVLVLVIGIGVFVRYRQQSSIPPRLKGAVENHYTRGTAGAPVVVKEFSDYT
jgi:anti-sigma-K factor RskA